MEKRLARSISKAEELRFYFAGDKQTLQGLFRTEPRSLETSGGRGCPRLWSAKVTEGYVRLRLHKACCFLQDAISGEVWAETPTCYHEENTSVT